MQFQYRYQILIWLCIAIDIEISFHTIKSIILHLLILQLSKIVLLTRYIKLTMNSIQAPYKAIKYHEKSQNKPFYV